MSPITRSILAVSTLALMLAPQVGLYAETGPSVITIKVKEAKVFVGQKEVATLKKGQKAYQTEEQGEWVGIQWEDANGNWQRGWVRAKQVSEAPAPKGKAG